MKGKVYLVGAGPGDYKLITLRAIEVIRKADVIVYDRLVSSNFLNEVKETCELVYVGKESSNHTMQQEDISKLLVQKAKEGKLVVRLKGGDPYVFGRGGEEGELLYDEGVDFEVVPGITSAIGGLCYAGIPITHRDYASSFHVITGHLKDEDKELDWKALASLKGTLVFLMGMSNLKTISQKLIEAGKDKTTPAAVINWATWSNQKATVGTIEDIYDKATSEGLKSPSLIVVGDVVSLRAKLNFFENKALHGKNIVVTRARAQSSSLVEAIEELGGKAIEVPAIKINKISPNQELDEAIYDLKKFNYIIFTSINGVQIFFERLFELGFDSRALSRLKIVAIGKATSKELNKYSICADILPKKFVSESIVEELREKLMPGDNILIPRAKEARSYLVDELRELCSVTEVKTYETILDDSRKEDLFELLNKNNLDYITFTSSSTVDNFMTMLGADNINLLEQVKLISIGPITSKTMSKYSLKVYREAVEYTIDGIMKCIIDDLKESIK
jgi:uroporphyrinogen III methyltransferase/synthase